MGPRKLPDGLQARAARVLIREVGRPVSYARHVGEEAFFAEGVVEWVVDIWYRRNANYRPGAVAAVEVRIPGLVQLRVHA